VPKAVEDGGGGRVRGRRWRLGARALAAFLWGRSGQATASRHGGGGVGPIAIRPKRKHVRAMLLSREERGRGAKKICLHNKS
jgi:hypothetical protein